MNVPAMSGNLAESVAALVLLFFLPGYALTKATFPEWRVRGQVAALRFVEIVTLSLFGSVALTVLAGYALLSVGPSGFRAFWGDPELEVALTAFAAVGLGVAVARGAFARTPPSARPDSSEEAPPWETVQALDDLRREERRVRHALRRAPSGSPEAGNLRRELERIRAEADEVARHREGEYAS